MKKILYCLLLFSCSLSAQEWQYLGLGSEGITSIAADWSNSNIIYAGSGSGFSSGKVGGIFKSTNGGATWDTLIRGVTTREIVIHPTNPNILYATLGINALTIAGIIKSTDGGTNWIRADSGIQTTWEVGPGPFVIDPKHPDTVYTGTGGPFGGKFYRSINGGTNWYSFGDTTYLRDGVTALALHPDSSNVIYAGTAWSGNVLKSINYGVNWSLTGFAAGIIYTIQFGSTPSTIYVGSSWTNNYPVGIHKTTDGGLSWSNPKLGLPETTNVSRILALNDNTNERVFLTTGWIYKSLQGQIWEKIEIVSAPVHTIMLSGRKLYAGSGGIYVMDIPTRVSENPLLLPRKSHLYDNFPNPFNPGTNIMYEICMRSNVLLEIYDIQGRKIRTLVRHDQPSGKYSIYWNGYDEKSVPVSSGVYFYVLQTGSYVTAKKMISLR